MFMSVRKKRDTGDGLTVAPTSGSLKRSSLTELALRFDEETKDAAGKKLLGLDSGLARLNELTSGIRGTMVLSGAPGDGKSTLMLQVVTHVLQTDSCGVLICSAEMSYDKVLGHVVSLVTGCSRDDIHHGCLHLPERRTERDQWNAFVAKHGSRLVVLDDDELSFARLLDAVHELKTMAGDRAPVTILDSLHAAVHVMGAR